MFGSFLDHFICYSIMSINMAFCLIFYRFETVYLDEDIRVVKDIRDDYLIVERAPYTWKE